jgi:hypothetical protein
MSKIRKYTDEELSRILSMAATGQLGSAGVQATACIEQAAMASAGFSKLDDTSLRQAVYVMWDHARQLKHAQGTPWYPDPEEALRWLEQKGLA